MTWTQDGLFPEPEPDRRPVPRSVPAPTFDAGPKYTAYRLKARTLCDDCVRAIHEMGIRLALPPNSVRWKRTHGTQVDLLCQAHKCARVERESKP